MAQETHLPLRPVKAKYGEPKHGDGFSVLFTLLMQDVQNGATRSEKEWHDLLTRTPKVSGRSE